MSKSIESSMSNPGPASASNSASASSNSATASAQNTNAALVPTQQAKPAGPVPCEQVLLQAARLAIELDRAILLDYYVDTFNKKAVIGEDEETKEKMLVKSREEYTSSITKIYKVMSDYIILTENSIYIVSGNVLKRKISSSSLIGNDM